MTQKSKAKKQRVMDREEKEDGSVKDRKNTRASRGSICFVPSFSSTFLSDLGHSPTIHTAAKRTSQTDSWPHLAFHFFPSPLLSAPSFTFLPLSSSILSVGLLPSLLRLSYVGYSPTIHTAANNTSHTVFVATSCPSLSKRSSSNSWL